MLEWDMATITAGDYTVEWEIPEAAYREWHENDYTAGGDLEAGVPPATSLKKNLANIIESTLTDELKKGAAIESGHAKKKDKPLEEVKIADITFAFNNYKLIFALRARGAHIAVNDFDAMRAQEKVVQSLFDSPEEFRELTRPTAAFITFEEEDARTLALQDREQTFMGRKLVFTETSEPTDIIWENRHWTRAQIFWRSLFAWIVILILMAGSFVFIYWVSSLSSKVARVFPTVDCETLRTNYGD